MLFLIQMPTLYKSKKSHNVTSVKAAQAQAATGTPQISQFSTPSLPFSPTPVIFSTIAPQNDYCLTVPVLLYHHIQPQAKAAEKKQIDLSVDNNIFEEQMKYLNSSGYTSLTTEQLVDALIHKTALPQKSIIVTLDDGYKDAYEYAFPVFQKYNITANLMIPPGLLGGSDYLNWEELLEMVHSGKIFITNHTWSHFAVGYGTPETIKPEVERAKTELEQKTGQHVDIFTYPYGSFSNLAISILQKEGYKGAFSTIHGFAQCRSFIMTLHRNHIGNAPLSAYGL